MDHAREWWTMHLYGPDASALAEAINARLLELGESARAFTGTDSFVDCGTWHDAELLPLFFNASRAPFPTYDDTWYMQYAQKAWGQCTHIDLYPVSES